jgi:hypothetical protein
VPEPPRRRTTALLIAVLAVLTAVLVVIFVLRLARQPGAKVNLGDQEFQVGKASQFAPRIASRGPLIFPPLRGGLTLYVQHLGPDPAHGWLAFAAQVPGPHGPCVVRWQPAQGDFAETCRGTIFPADGRGLPHYRVRVDQHGEVVINLRAPAGTEPPAQ